MKLVPTDLSGLFVIEPSVMSDDRGSFKEVWRTDRFSALGLSAEFVQDNESVSKRGVLRGLHFQNPNGQLKLCRVVRGEVFDAVVDVRRGSPTFGKSFTTTLSAANHRELWIPPGFAHGFVALSDEATFLYKVSAYWSPADERGVAWNDPSLGIAWPITSPSVSAKDATFVPLRSLPADALPTI